MANIEHVTAQQSAAEAQEKRELEESIQQLVQAHTDAANSQIIGRIPYPSAKVLWPIIGIINTLWARLQRSQQNEDVKRGLLFLRKMNAIAMVEK